MNETYRIYALIFPDGKRYIGATRYELEKRWNKGRNYKTCPLVHRAIEKYGWDNVVHELIDVALTKQDAEEKERYYIAKYDTTNEKYGYNYLPGGDVSTNAVDEEMKYKLGNGWRGKHRSEEEKKKIAEGVRNRFKREESNGHFGMKHSEETKRKMSLSHGSRPVIQYTKDGKFVKRWEFAKDAANAGIADKTNILGCCNHYKSCLSAGGYKWEYEENVL